MTKVMFARYFAVYCPNNSKVYMVSVTEAPKSTDMTLRFKSAGLVRGNHKSTHVVPYEQISDPRFHWAEDYEMQWGRSEQIKNLLNAVFRRFWQG